MRISDWSSDVCSSDLADFIGTMNFLDGVLSDVEGGDQAVVQTDGIGPLRALKGGLELTPKMPVTIAIRPEKVQPTWDRRSEERRVGKEWGSTCSSRWSPSH